MNILRLSLYVPTATNFSEGIGGAQEHIYQVSKIWAKKGHNVKVISAYRDYRIPKKEVIDGFEIERVGSFSFATYYIKKAYKKYEDWADIVIESYTSYPLFTPLYVKKPRIVVIHSGLLGKKYLEVVNPIKGIFGYIGEKILFKIYRNEKIILTSKRNENILRDHGISNIKIIYSGVNTSFFTPGEKYDKPIILFVGNFANKNKRIEDLIRAFNMINKYIKNIKLIIVGYGGKRSNIAMNACKTNKNIKYLGYIRDKKLLRKLYQKAWVFVLPSIQEQFPLSLLEANACGTPAIVYKLNNIDTIQEGINCITVKKMDIKELADKIIQIIEDDKLRKKLGRSSRKFSENFSWEFTAEKYLNIFNELI